MPTTKKGSAIKKAMQRFYGKVKGTRVFSASERKGIIQGVRKKTRDLLKKLRG